MRYDRNIKSCTYYFIELDEFGGKYTPIKPSSPSRPYMYPSPSKDFSCHKNKIYELSNSIQRCYIYQKYQYSQREKNHLIKK